MRTRYNIQISFLVPTSNDSSLIPSTVDKDVNLKLIRPLENNVVFEKEIADWNLQEYSSLKHMSFWIYVDSFIWMALSAASKYMLVL